MLGTILGVLTGLAGPIVNLGSQIVDLQKQKSDGKTQVAKAEIDERVQALHDQRAVLIAEAGNRLASALNASVRLLLALGPIVILLKLYAWDKAVGSFMGCSGPAAAKLAECATFRTDPLDTNQWAVIAAVTGFYFLHSMFKK